MKGKLCSRASQAASKILFFLVLVMFVGLGVGRTAPGDGTDSPVAGRSIRNDLSPPLRDIPPLPIDFGGEREANLNPRVPSVPEFGFDPVVQDWLAPPDMLGPVRNFDGIPFPGVTCNCAPPDPDGEVGATQYVQMVNMGIQVFDKATGASQLGPIGIATLWSGFGGVCQNNGRGDPVVVYDQLANRWVVSQFAGTSIPTDECIAVSATSDATGAWYRYDFNLGSNFYDYPKLSVWPDAYYMADNVFNAAGTVFLGPQAFAFNRSAMLTGSPATFVTIGPMSTTLGSMLAGDLDGSILPPAGAPNPWLSIDGATWSLFRFHVDFAVPANSTFTLAGTLAAAGYTSLCPSTSECVPQLGSANNLAGIGDRPMFRLAYRRFSDGHEALVGNLSVSSSGVAAIRWWEINHATSGTPAFEQQSTYQPDTTWRWLGSAAMDGAGNLAVGFSASSAAIFPQIRYAGRLSNDPPGFLSQGEATLHAGTGSQTGTSNRWGDYSALSVDPMDDCTFWYTNEYYATTGSFNWRTRIGSFKFAGCGLPDFSLSSSPSDASICVGQSADFNITVSSVGGFGAPVTLSASGQPASWTAGFSVNPVTPPGSSLLTIGSTGGTAPGLYPFQVAGNAAPLLHTTALSLTVFDALPATPVLVSPANGATNQAFRPTFQWSGGNAQSYTLEVATDAAFTNVVYTATVGVTTVTPGVDLESNTRYFWRVRATNSCGVGSYSAVYSFYTLALPGDCAPNTQPEITFFDNLESGASGWSHSGTGDTWALSGTYVHSGSFAFLAADPATISNQRLVSPPIVLPAGEFPLTLQFWNRQEIEHATAGCYDGAIAEISLDSGSTWTQLPDAGMFTDHYDGPVSSAFGNPLAGLPAWCGDPQDWLDSVVDLNSFAGQTVWLGFRLGSDNSVSRTGWAIDDVKIQSCRAVQADLYASITDHTLYVLPGGTATYSIRVGNNGSGPVVGATVTTGFPAVLTGVSWTCTGAGGGTCSAAGSGNINDIVDLPVGATATYTGGGAVPIGATGWLVSSVTVAVPPGVSDPAPGNNTAVDIDALETPLFWDGFESGNTSVWSDTSP